MIDFTNCKINNYKYYGGQNGNKICIKYNEEDYMLKFPGINKENEYSNSCISEYVSCQIMSTLGLKTQETLLGKYTLNNKEKIVVVCKDFVAKGFQLKQFAEIKNGQIDSTENGYGTDLEEVIKTIENQNIVEPIKLKEFFWDMFIADALVGNFDRHNGNWGFLINEEAGLVEIAPIYDCASCLYPALKDDNLKEILQNEEEKKARVFIFPNKVSSVSYLFNFRRNIRISLFIHLVTNVANSTSFFVSIGS